MRISVKVKPNSKKEEILKTENGYEVRLKASPKEGKANEELIRMLSRELDIPKTRIKIIRGASSRNKVLEI